MKPHVIDFTVVYEFSNYYGHDSNLYMLPLEP